jgi:hypothetical protein
MPRNMPDCQFRILRLSQHYNGFRSETGAKQSSARGGSAVCGTRDLAARSGGRGPAAARAGGPGVDRPRSRSRSSRAAHRGRSAAPARRPARRPSRNDPAQPSDRIIGRRISAQRRGGEASLGTAILNPFYSWPSTAPGASRLRPGTVKPWSSLIARARKSGVGSPGACRAPGWHGVRWSSAAKLNR